MHRDGVAGRQGGPLRAVFASIGRNEFLAALFFLGCANGVVARAVGAVHRVGWTDAVIGSFDVSAIVLVACAAGLWLTAHSRAEAVTSGDVVAGAIALPLIVLPLGGLSWLAVTGLALHALRRADQDQTLRRGAAILLATTVPMLWSSLLFQFFANVILDIDAALVAWILGTERAGNVVRFVSGDGNLVVFPACSSLANMSLAFLTWVTISEWVGHRRRVEDVLWCALGCGSVIAINIGRMSLMAVNLPYYEAVHSDLGDAIVSALILTAVFGWSLLGVRRKIRRS